MELLKKTKWLTLSLILAIVISLLSIINYLDILSQIDKSESAINDGYIFYSLQHEANPLNQDIAHFKQIYSELTNNNGYIYFEIYTQYLEMPNQNSMFFENGTDELSNKCTGVNCIQISNEVIDNFEIDISDGKCFQKSDYIYELNKPIPVLMGQSYRTLYEIGDIIEATYLFDAYRFKIIGFLSSGSNIQNASHNIILDKYIVMPSFIIDESIPITNGLKIHYANKTSGTARLDSSNFNTFNNFITPLLEKSKAGSYSWSITPLEYQYRKMFNIGIKHTIALLIILIIPIMLWYLYLVYKSSKARKKTSLLSGQNIFLYVVLLTITSIFCGLIHICFVTTLGIKLIQINHLILIVIISLITVLLNHIFNQSKSILPKKREPPK